MSIERVGDAGDLSSGAHRLSRRMARWRDPLIVASKYYLLTCPIIVLAVVFSFDVVRLSTFHSGSSSRTDLASCFLAWDGRFYAQIVSTGYIFTPDASVTSNVGFFPAYPLTASLLVQAFQLTPGTALLIVSNLSYFAALAVIAAYLRHRYATHSPMLVEWVLVGMVLFPTTYFYRMAYSEPLCLLTMATVLLGMELRWRPIFLAMLVGLTTAVRPVGLALLLPFYAYLLAWSREQGEGDARYAGDDKWSWMLSVANPRFLWRAVLHFPVCIWGILAFIAFQSWAFDDPFAFMEAHRRWAPRPADFQENLWRLISFEPIRAVYDSSGPCYWGLWPPRENPFLNLHFANPLYFLFGLAMVFVGWYRHWLNPRELLLALGLLLIPYCLHGGRACMASHARYASLAFPAFFVVGHLLYRMPATIAAALCGMSAVLLALYTALFASWYSFY